MANERLELLVAGANHTYVALDESMRPIESEVRKESREYVTAFYIVLACNLIAFTFVMAGLAVQNKKYHVCSGIMVILCGFAAIGFITFQAQQATKFLEVSTAVCLYNA